MLKHLDFILKMLGYYLKILGKVMFGVVVGFEEYFGGIVEIWIRSGVFGKTLNT